LSADLTWTLRRAAADDAAALSLVASATFLEAFAGVLAGADIVAHCAAKSNPAAFAQWSSDPASIVTLAEAGNGAAPLAYTVLTAPDLPIEIALDDIELKRIYVLERAHGGGLAGELMARALGDARALGKRRMLLGVYGGNRRAQRFYEKQGFAVAGTRQFQVGNTLHDDLIYARQI
jgi:diamine N-acetyltransferase